MIQITRPSPENVLALLRESQQAMHSCFKSCNMGDLAAAARAFADVYAGHREALLPFLNTNTIDSALQRTFILNDMVRAFRKKLIPVTVFSTVFRNVPLEGTN